MPDSDDRSDGVFPPGEVGDVTDTEAPSIETPNLDKSIAVDEPSIETPDLDKSIRSGETDTDPESASLFWRLVIVFDVALFALVVGPAFWYFEGRRVLGLQLTLLGVVAFGYGVYRLRTRTTDEERDGEGRDDEA